MSTSAMSATSSAEPRIVAASMPEPVFGWYGSLAPAESTAQRFSPSLL